MSLSRRSFVRSLGIGAGAMLSSRAIGARGWEAYRFGEETDFDSSEIILSSNENPMGPGNIVMEAIQNGLGASGSPVGRYPFAYRSPLSEAIAERFNVKPENILVGCGSTQVLVTATHVYTSKDRHLTGALPTYEECSDYAAFIGAPVRSVPLDSSYRMDMDRTLHAARGSGLLFYCNPNNPVSTMIPNSQTKDFLTRMLAYSPETRILVDEAYIDYVTDPQHESMIPLALADPRVIVARTFSKAYGMAGMRIGYAIAHADTIKEMGQFHQGNSISLLSYVAATAAIQTGEKFIANERERNRQVRDFTTDFFRKAGHTVADSQTNFLFVDVGMPIHEFQAACKERGVRVGRPFPPLWTHCRISLGTMEEMQRATRVFAQVLEKAKKAA